MDGHEVARKLRQTPEGKNLLLIAVTGYGQASDRLRSREAGFDDHLVKPINLEKLATLMAATPARDRLTALKLGL